MKLKRMVMAISTALLLGAIAAVPAMADVAVTDVVAKQRYPWNGLVDITCKVTGIEGTANGLYVTVSAVMPDTGKTRKVSHFWVVQGGTNSTDRAVHVNGDYRLLWDARADLDYVIYSNMVVRVALDVHDKVQLWKGGPYWAVTNIGAEEPWEFGYYFWWGDTIGYKRENDAWVASDGSTSSFSFSSENTPTYNKSLSTLQSEGWIKSDGSSNYLALTPEHDAANVQWGGGWRMPTYQELDDLCKKCDWTWTTKNGVDGYVICGRGDNALSSIFLPAAGRGDGTSRDSDSYGYYWSSVLSSSYSKQVYELRFSSDCLLGAGNDYNYYYEQFMGMSVRPVQGVEESSSMAVGQVGYSAPFLLDTVERTRIAREIESIAYSTAWVEGAPSDAQVVVEVNGVTLSTASGEGDIEWTPPASGSTFTLTHKVMSSGKQYGEMLTVKFKVPAKVTGVVAKQRYPWNGLVDIACKVSGVDGALSRNNFAVVALNPDSGDTCCVSNFWIEQNDNNGDYRLVWDARADLGPVDHSNMVVRVVVDTRGKVQLWEGGPYWAEMNVGAENPWESGYYFWWGDTVGYTLKDDLWVPSYGLYYAFSFVHYDPTSAQTWRKGIDTLKSEGWVTENGVLAPEHDAAQVQWGGGWRMPTRLEQYNLCNNCDWTWTTTNGVNGCVVRGRGDYVSSSIFLPAAGTALPSLVSEGSAGCYWLANPDLSSNYDEHAYDMEFVSSGSLEAGHFVRYAGRTVRPVQGGTDGTMTVAEATIAEAGESAPFLLDTMDGTRIARAVETITYSPHWNGAVSCSVTIDGKDAPVASATSEGTTSWNTLNAGIGGHTLTHMAGDETLTARFVVLGDDVAVHAGTMGTSETWGANKTHLVVAAVMVPSGVSLMIEQGAVVKFMPGTSLMVASGGSCTARGVIFTHVNDDTIGGDTLYDGDGGGQGAGRPTIGDYTITGTIIDDDSTEYNYMRPQTLASNISSNTRLRGHSTYIVSNSVTVASGATLTLQPGTIIKFVSGCSLTVNGTLDAHGTRAAPIVFTSIKDDEHGGDTNGDGDKTYAYAGDWYQIRVKGTATFNYCHVLYNSSTENYGAVEAYGGTVNFDNSEIAHTMYECVNAHSSGNFTARNSVFRDSSLGFGYYGSGRVKAYNCVFSDLSVAVRQSGKMLTNCAFYRCLAFTDQNGDGSTYSHCLFFNPDGYGAQSYTKCGSSGNIWGDPFFEDPDNSDIGIGFSVNANSPCIDAGDSADAPEYDWYGQSRNGVPDIGIYEVQGDTGTGYDLAAVAVSSTGDSPVQGGENAQAARSTIGDTISISYTVSNVGRKMVADPWHDALYLVSASSGKQYALGEPLNSGGLGAGESRTFSAQFTLPVVPVGLYRFRLVVNSRRMDVPEGAATENNIVVSEDEIELVANSIDASEGASGSVAAGASAVCAFNIPEGSGDRLLRITSAAGGMSLSARSGLGFLPVDASSGIALSFSGGEAWLSVPAGTEKVWLVLDNDGASAATYTVDFHDGALALAGVSPSSIPSSGNVTVEIKGAGFTDDCTVSFTGAGTVAPLAVRRVSSGLFAVTVDASAFSVGSTYAVTVRKGDESKTLESALTVEKAPGQPKFWAKLDVPSSMRQGRLMETCFIEYGNSGTADMLSPVLQVSLTGDGTLGYIGGLSGLKTLQFVAAGDAGSAGVLRPGSSHRIRFAVRAGASNKISLHTSEGSDYAPAPWTNAADYLSDLSAAATRIDLRGQDATDYVRVSDLAKAVKNGEPSSVIYGRVVDEDGEAIKNLILDFTNATVSTSCRTDGNGGFCTKGVEGGTYELVANGVLAIKMQNPCAVSKEDVSIGNIIARTDGNIMIRLVNATKNNVIIAASTENGTSHAPSYWNSDTEAVFSGVPDGSITVECIHETGCRKSAIQHILGGGTVSMLFDFSTDGVLTVDFESLGMAVPKGFLLYDGTELECVVIMHGDTTCRIDGIAPGDYMMISFTDTAIPNEPIELHVPREGVTAMKSSKNLRMVLRSDGGAYEVIRRKHKEFLFIEEAVDDAVKYARELLSRTFPPPTVKCEHNLALYAKQASLRGRFQDELARFQMLETAFEKSIEAKSDIIGENLLGLGIDAASAFFQTLKKLPKIAGVLSKLATRAYSVYEALGDGNIEFNDKITMLLAVCTTDAEIVTALKKAGMEVADFLGIVETTWSVLQHLSGLTAGIVAPITDIDEDAVFNRFIGEMQAYEDTLSWTYDACSDEIDDPLLGDPVDDTIPTVPKSWDPNEMVGEKGVGDARYVKPGQELTYTIYFENKAGFDIADAQEVKVTNPLSEWLDWSTFAMREVAFNNQCDVNLDGLANGTSEVQMNGTNKYVRTTVECDAEKGVVTWYMRVYDPNGDSEGYPTDLSGFLPSNDDTHRGEGHITYRVSVRDDAPANVVITNSAVIVFDGNPPIETDPAWWNTVGSQGASFAESEVVVNEGEAATIRINGGSAENAASVKVYLTYNTAAAADVDLKNAQAARSANLKFPLTLTWEAGEVGEKVITIPVKTDKTVEDDEFFTLQLADAVGMELGEDRVCTVTIHDPGYNDLEAKIANGTASKSEKSAWDKLQKAKAPYVRGLADPADGGKVTGSGLCAAGKKVTLKATANKNFTFMGWVAADAQERVPPAGGTQSSATEEYIATTPTLVIDRSAKPAASSKTSTTITEVDGDVTYFAVFKSDPSVTVEVYATDGTGSEPTGKGAGKYVAGTITGAGKYAPGKKVTLKATANKGYVFSSWQWSDDETATFCNRYSRDSSISFAMSDFDIPVFAEFVTIEEDAEYGIGLMLGDDWAEDGLFADSVLRCGIAVNWPIAVDALSATTIKVAGLPTGLKLVQDKETKEYRVEGVPTAASKTNAKTGELILSVVKFTVTTAGKAKRTFSKNVVVKPLPQWAYGTFNGSIGHQFGAEDDYRFDGRGTMTMTVTAAGKISGKVMLDGKNYTFSANGYSESSYVEVDDSDAYLMLDGEAKSGKTTIPVVLYGCRENQWLSDEKENATNYVFWGDREECGGYDVELRRNLWKDTGNAAALLAWTGAYTYATSAGDVLSLTVDEKGGVKAVGKLGAKRKVSLSTALHPYFVDVYVAPTKTDTMFFERIWLANWHAEAVPGGGIAYRDAGMVMAVESLDGTGSGTVTANPKYGQAAAGKTVTLTAKAAKDSVFVKWVYEDEDGDEIWEYSPTLKLVSSGNDMYVRAVFAAKENVTLPKPYAYSDDYEFTHMVVGVPFWSGVGVDDTSRPVSFTAKNLPAGLKIDKTTGDIYGTPTKAFDGIVTVTVTSTLNSKMTSKMEIPMTVHALPD